MIHPMRKILPFLTVPAAGGLGGCLIAFVLIAFGFWIGRGGYTGEVPGEVHWALAWQTASTAGTLLGVILFSVGYLVFLIKVPFRRAAPVLAASTFLGGFLGALADPGVAALSGSICFFIACGWLDHRQGSIGERTSRGAAANSHASRVRG
jgi:hypothetical protein